MKNQSYYRIPDSQCDIAVTDRHLMVNCTGVCVFDQPFANRHSRGRRDYYLMYLHCGSLKIEVGGKSSLLEAGELVIYPANQPYSYAKIDDTELIYYWTHFSGSEVLSDLKELGLLPGKIWNIGQSESIPACFERLFQCFYTREPFFEQETSARFSDILIYLARKLRRKAEDGTMTAKKIRTSLDYLYRNYNEDVRLERLAELEHLSPSRYSAVFKQSMGVSPQGFLISLRMENAADLLRRTDLSIKQVALAVGYDDPLYFSNIFKRKMGVAPSRYQEQWR